MRSSILPYLVSVAFFAAASPSLANVTISNAATANMACVAGVCSPTATDAVLNVQDLANLLAAGNATVTTTGTGVEATNIRLEAPLQWSAATILSLMAYHSVQFRRPVKVAGTGAVALTINNGGSGGEFACIDHGRLQFANLSGALTINGTQYVLVDSIASLAGAIAADPSGAFALAKHYDAGKDGIYLSSPIPTVFTGTLQGLGNTISNLSIDDTTNGYVGLFAETATGSAISNVRLVDENVQGPASGYVGGVVGFGSGTILHSFNSGSVSGGGAVGGLVGGTNGIVVSDSGSSAGVSGSDAGGLIGVPISGSISDSWATGSVSGYEFVGGLVGFDVMGGIKHSWASGQVWASEWAGGLVGRDDVPIERSYASGAVSCGNNCGGLVGLQGDETDWPGISECYATGSVTGGSSSSSGGGLVGVQANGRISNSYALGAVSGGSGVAGLVGANEPWAQSQGAISTSYAAGAVTGTYPAGGLIGWDDTTIRHTYWDRTTSGITNPDQGAGNVADAPGIKGLSDRKLKSGLPKGFNPAIWAENPDINNGLPYLIHNPPK